MLKSPIIYIDLFEVISLSSLSSKYSWKRLGALCCPYHTTNDVTFLRKLDFDLKWLQGFIRYFFNHISGNHWYTSQHLQKLEMSAHPGMLGLKSISLPLIILLSETPIMLNSKFNSSNRWTWKFSRFRLRLLILLCKREKLESLTRLGSSLLNL